MASKRKFSEEIITLSSDEEDNKTKKAKRLAYAKYTDLLSPWECCEIDRENDITYSVRFCCDNKTKSIAKYEMAEYERPTHQLQSGCRIIAELNNQRYIDFNGFFAGIIGETIKKSNDFQYFIFFDNGRVDYVLPKNVRKVFGDYGWTNVHQNAIEYMKYLNEYKIHRIIPESINKRINVEYDGNWLFAQITSEIGTKLIQITYEDTKRTEWLYRGSMRISNIWRLYIYDKKILNNKVAEEYLLLSSDEENDDPIKPNNSISCINDSSNETDNRSIIKQLKVQQLDIYCEPKKFARHQCKPNCHPNVSSNELNKYGPLTQPLIVGWRRSIKKQIIYHTPCGKEMRKMYDIQKYLYDVQYHYFDVDNFCLDKNVNCLSHCDEVRNVNSIISNDISNGLEQIPIRVVNAFNHEMPDHFEYVTECVPKSNVPNYLELGREITSCCNCENDCLDRVACPCWQMTYDGREFTTESTLKFGYEFKRLSKLIHTGIFECNTKCKCSKKCTNRVAQLPIKHRLELFKTKECGWGVRALEDIPPGAFVCNYYGELMTEAQSNLISLKHGDSYLAQLSFIESGEDYKNEYTDNYNDLINNIDNNSYDLWSVKIKSIPYYPLSESQVDTKKSVRRFFGRNEAIYIIDGKRFGNIGRFFNHCCDPNMFLQNVFINTQDLRFPTLALFALNWIKAGTELRWNYNYEVGSVPNRVIHCHCGSEHCIGRLL